MTHFRGNPAYTECVRLLIELHLLMKAGESESPAADRVRDLLEQRWPGLEVTEVERVEDMSADLYTLEADSPIVHPEHIAAPKEAIWNELHERQTRRDFAAVLAFLREHPQEFDRASAALERGAAYLQLQDYDIALLFLDEANRLRPGDPTALACRLAALTNCGCEAEAEQVANQIAADGTADAMALVVAGLFLFLQATKWQSSERTRLYAGGVKALQRGLTLFAGKMLNAEARQAVKSAHLCIAVWLEDTGKPAEARQECLAALSVDPHFESALTLLGWLDFQQTPDGQHSNYSRIFAATIPRLFGSLGTQAA